jgi:hypothetical protein
MRKKIRDVISPDVEPTWENVEEPNLVRALNWYNANKDCKDSKKYLIHHLTTTKYPKKKLESIKNLPDWFYSNVGFVCRIKERGGPLSKENESWLKGRFEELYQESLKIKIVAEKTKAPKVSIQERTEAVAQEFIGDMEVIMDEMMTSRKFDFKAYEWMTKNQVKPLHAKHIKAFFDARLVEIEETIAEVDPQLTEAYSFLNPKEMNKFYVMLQSIVEDADKVIHNGKAARQPRKRKAVPVEKLIGKLKYKKEDTEFKIKSINPSEIIGAVQLWVFNTKYRKLGVYNSDFGFTIKGTTIQNFNEQTSIQKKIRKPLEILPVATQGGKVALRKLMDNIRAVEQKMTGRINEETIILRAIK